jgi:MATE family multidrug resistance protein
LYVTVPDLFLFGFFAQNQTDTSPQIRTLAVILLRYVAAYNTFDALNIVFASAVKGAGDTHFVFSVSLTMAILLAAGTWVGMTWLGFTLHHCWTFVTLWVSLLGCMYLLRFRQGKWRTMRVID